MNKAPYTVPYSTVFTVRIYVWAAAVDVSNNSPSSDMLSKRIKSHECVVSMSVYVKEMEVLRHHVLLNEIRASEEKERQKERRYRRNDRR